MSKDPSAPTVVLPEAVAGPVDAVLRGAIELARAAAELEAGPYARVGEHLGVWPVAAGGGGKGAVHAFAATDPAYVGWYWAVEVARVPRSKVATVDDASLLPGAEAIVVPAWVPWSERLLPGDVGVGDILPTAADDPRLVLRMADTEGWIDDALWLELGLGRPRVMSALGREEAADRWYEGKRGPGSDIAEAAPASCDSCGFFVGLVGTLGVAFGACANEMAPADGKVVARTYGCGAHSEALVVEPLAPAPVVTFGGDLPVGGAPAEPVAAADIPAALDATEPVAGADLADAVEPVDVG